MKTSIFKVQTIHANSVRKLANLKMQEPQPAHENETNITEMLQSTPGAKGDRDRERQSIAQDSLPVITSHGHILVQDLAIIASTAWTSQSYDIINLNNLTLRKGVC